MPCELEKIGDGGYGDALISTSLIYESEFKF
jgi:hypothetical protein